MSRSKAGSKKRHQIGDFFDFSFEKKTSTLLFFSVKVASDFVREIKNHTIDVYKNKIQTSGFLSGQLPDSYVSKNCLSGISDSCQKYLLKFYVLDYLDKKIQDGKIICSSYPKLTDVQALEDGGLEYFFKGSIISCIEMEGDWTEVPFSPPRRKLYKDLDRQADSFVKEAEDIQEKSSEAVVVESGDWVFFDSVLVKESGKDVFPGQVNSFWFKVNTKYITSTIHKVFLGKADGDIFTINELPVFGLPSDLLSVKGQFKVTIKKIVKAGSFSLDLFKKAFFLESSKEVHEKLIEIFSFRSDISQRRLIIEEAFRVLFSRIRFEVPRYMILRRQDLLLASVRELPDYNVYKMDPSFDQKVSLLAERQIKEEVLANHMSQILDISVQDDDVAQYLNLLNHPRLIEFVYFRPLPEIYGDVSLPVREAFFNLFVLKEKVLNNLIHSLSD